MIRLIPVSRPFSRVVNFLLPWRWLLLILATPFLLFPSPSTAPVLIIVPGLGLLAWLAGYAPLPRTRLNPALLLLELMLLVSVWVTYDVVISLPKIAGLVLGIGVFFCFVSFGQGARGWALCLLTFLATGVGIALLGLLGTQWAFKFDFLASFTYRFEPRITGLPGAEQGISPNELAGALLWVIPTFLALSYVGWAQLRNRTNHSQRWLVPTIGLIWEATFFVVLVFLLCQSRSGYLAVAVSGALVILWWFRHRWRWLLSSLVIVGILIGTFAWRYETDRATRQEFDTYIADDLALVRGGFEGRDTIWSRASLGIEKYPLTGMGMNTFRYLVNTLDPLHPIYVGRDIAHAHNEFLQVALDLGLPGLIAFVMLYLVAFWRLRQLWRQATQELGASSSIRDFSLLGPRAVRMVVLGLGWGLVAHLLYGLTDAVTLGAKPGILFWMLLGLLVGLDDQKNSRATP